jgi:DNA-binding GntR family transcriptional regulator
MIGAMTIDEASPEWPYRQLATQIRARIERGELGPRLPSIMSLAEQARVSTRTMQRAIDLLKEEGVLYTAPGRGTFVVPESERRQ